MRGDSDETGSWNTIWILVRSVFSLSPSALEHVDRPVAVVEGDGAAVRRHRAHQDLADRGLAAAAFADQAEAFAAPDVEADAVDGAHRRLGVLAEPAGFA